jgi:hypothetical protein
MAWYEIGFTTTSVTTGRPVAAFRAPTRTSRLWELGWSCNAATASGITIYRNTASDYLASASTSVGQATNPLWSPGTSLVDTAWTNLPTIVAASKYRKGQLPASVGAQWVWTFRDGIWVRSNTATDILVLWNETGVNISILNGYVVWEE